MRVFLLPLILKPFTSGNPKGKVYQKSKLIVPQHCNKFMLLAGEPKRDVHNLFGAGTDMMIDPVDNLPYNRRAAKRFKIKEFMAEKEKDPTND